MKFETAIHGCILSCFNRPKPDARERLQLAASRRSVLHFLKTSGVIMSDGGATQLRGRGGDDAAGRRLRILLTVPSLIYIGATLLVWWHPYARRSLTSMAVGAAMSTGALIEAMLTVVALALFALRPDLRTRNNAFAMALGCGVALSFWLPYFQGS